MEPEDVETGALVAPTSEQQEFGAEWAAQQTDDATVCSALGVGVQLGLPSSELEERRHRHGRNSQDHLAPRYKSVFRIFISEIREPMMLLLLAVGVLFFVFEELLDALFVTAIICAVVLIEVVNEYRAKKAVALLCVGSNLQRTALVRRDGGSVWHIPVDEIVVGDVLLLRAGMRVPCDCFSLSSSSASVEESLLTGESAPVHGKRVLLAGSTVVEGSAECVAVAVGLSTTLATIATSAKQTKDKKTPLQKLMKRLAFMFAIFGLSFAVAVFVGLWLRTNSAAGDALLYAAALAFVVIPEELPLLIKAVLAVGAYGLSKDVIIKKVSAVEAVAGCEVLVIDKTGTLTRNQLQVEGVYDFDSQRFQRKDNLQGELLRCWMMQTLDPPSVQKLLATGLESLLEIFDPFDRAVAAHVLLHGIDAASVDVSDSWKDAPCQHPRMCMRALHKHDQQETTTIAAKGSLEAVSSFLELPLESIQRQLSHWSREGLRVVGYALGNRLLGAVTFHDPVRSAAKDALRALMERGINVIVASGDQPENVKHVLLECLGPSGVEVVDVDGQTEVVERDWASRPIGYSRCSAAFKAALVAEIAKEKQVMFAGDGVNDVMALANAHVGIAMGLQSADMAKDAASIVLPANDLLGVVATVTAGRRLVLNLFKAVAFYLACKVAIMSLVVTFGAVQPFSPRQLIVMEAFMDVGASVSFLTLPIADRFDRRARPRTFSRIFLAGKVLAAVVAFAALFLYFPILVSSFFAVPRQDAAFVAWMGIHVLVALSLALADRVPMWEIQTAGMRNWSVWALAVAVLLVVYIFIYAPLAQILFVLSGVFVAFGLSLVLLNRVFLRVVD